MSLPKRIIKFLVEGKKRAKINRRFNRREIRGEASRLKTHPWMLVLDPTTICNLRCPFCPTGDGTLALKKEILQPATFYAIVSNIRLKYIFVVCLYNFGEPFLNPHIFDYTRFFHQRGITTVIHTNFSVKDYGSEFFEKIVLSGLDELTVSIDGASQETYEKYRVGGNFDRVVANMAGLTRVKNRLGATIPQLRYKMLINKFNESEVDEARRIAQRVGAEFWLDENFEVPVEFRDEWVATSIKEKYGDIQPTLLGREVRSEIFTFCRQMWDTLVINANGDLFPCCGVKDHAMAIGNLARDHIDTLWNNDRMVKLRQYVVDPESCPPDFPNLCERCPHRYAIRKPGHQIPGLT